MNSCPNPTSHLINVERHIVVEVDATTGILQQHVVLHTGELMLAENFSSICTAEKEVREALIKLGWTPPSEGTA